MPNVWSLETGQFNVIVMRGISGAPHGLSTRVAPELTYFLFYYVSLLVCTEEISYSIHDSGTYKL